MNAEQINNALELCKGKPVEKVTQLIDLMWGEDAVADMAEHFGCPNDKQAVAEYLANGGAKPEEVEDLPETEEIPAEIPSESEKSVSECTADAENEILNEENEGENEENEEKPARSAEKKEEKKKADKPKFQSNLPTGLSFNPLVMAIKPFYDKLIAEDEIFAGVVKEREGRKEKPKSLSECADYIMSEAYNYASAHRNGNCGFAGFPDDDMYRLIRHYYDEEFLEVHKITGARSVVSAVPTPKSPKKKEEKPKPKPNVVDITKAIVSATKTDDGKKKEKKKDNLLAGFVPMERPNLETYEKDAKKGSRQQAKSVEQPTLALDW